MKTSPNSNEQESPPGRPTDSPWLWLAIFLAGALVALVLTAPRFSWRQPQIERQFQARERSGHAVSANGGFSPLSTTNHPMLTLRPLLIFFTVALFATTFWFWWNRFAHLRRAVATAESAKEEPRRRH